MSEMSGMIAQTVEHASSSLSITEQVFQFTEDGKEVMNENVNSMQSIKDANYQLNEIVTMIEEISEKASVINDIVFKPSYLHLMLLLKQHVQDSTGEVLL